MVFPTFFNLSLNLAIRSSWSEPQSAPGLVFVDCIELLCQEYTEELYKKDLYDPDNHNGVITDLELDVLECEV